jgi:hypothetical protein
MKSEDRQRESAHKSDVTRPGNTGTVKGIEKVGGPTGVRFPVHDHHDVSVVRGPGGKMDK